MFDQVVVGVVNLPIRKVTPLFSAEERVRFVENATRHLENVKVETFATLVVDFAHAKGAKVIVKGLRAISDFEYEFEMDALNRMQALDIESVYLMASPNHSFLRSSGVKELAAFGGNIDGLVPEEVAARLLEELAR